MLGARARKIFGSANDRRLKTYAPKVAAINALEAEVAAGDLAKARAELGDVLFVCANLARKLDIEPEDALRATNAKFTRRFAHIEKRLAERGKTPDQSDLAEMDALWDEARAADKIADLGSLTGS